MDTSTDRLVRTPESLRPAERPTVPAELVVYESIDELRPEWDRLAARVGAPLFVRSGWFDAWVGAFEPRGFRLVAVRRDGRLAGVMPVILGRRALHSATNFHTPFYAPLAEDLDTLRDLICGALTLRHGGLDVNYVPRAGATAAVLRDLAGDRGLRSMEIEIGRQPYVDTSGCWNQYLATVPRKPRREVGRLRRRLEEQGALELSVEETSAEALDEGLSIEGSGWKTDAGSAILSCPHTERFYRRVADWAREEGWLKLALLRLDGRMIAFDLCLQAGGAVCALKGGFDPEMRRFGPGTLLTYESLARAFAAEDIVSYEFLGTDEPYKLVWTQHRRPLARIQLFAPTPGGVARYVARRHLRPAAKRAAGYVRLRPQAGATPEAPSRRTA
jgi:CelD/BcsL family acetyltransferase involved in cellulose biosynthesis